MKRFEQQRQYNPTTYQLPQGPLQAPDLPLRLELSTSGQNKLINHTSISYNRMTG